MENKSYLESIISIRIISFDKKIFSNNVGWDSVHVHVYKYVCIGVHICWDMHICTYEK